MATIRVEEQQGRPRGELQPVEGQRRRVASAATRRYSRGGEGWKVAQMNILDAATASYYIDFS
jgi:hypothetical protein